MAEDIQILLERHTSELDEHERRIHALEKGQDAVNRLILDVAKISAKLDYMSEKLDRLESKVETLEQKPAKRWDGLVTAIISAAIGIFVGWIMVGR